MSQLDRHVGAVRRKLALGVFLHALAWGAVALAAAALGAVLITRTKLIPMPPLMALYVSGAAAIVAACVWAILRMPGRRNAAVAIDQKLGLKEKFSTALFIRPSDDAFAQAAVRDAEATAQRVNLAGQFKLALPRQTFWAIGLVGLALLSSLITPFDLFGREAARKAAEKQIAQAEAARQVVRDALARVQTIEQKIGPNEAVELARKVLEPLSKDTIKDPARAKITATQALQDLQAALKNEAKRVEQINREAQRDANRMFDKVEPDPSDKSKVAEAQRDIARGDFAKAIAKLEDELKDIDKKDKKDQEQAAKNLDKLAKQLEQLAKDPKVQQQMQQQLQQQMQNMGQNQQQAQKDAQQMANLMKQAAAGNQQAAQQLQNMANQIAQQLGNNPAAAQQLQKAIAQAQAKANAQCNAGQMAGAAQQLQQAVQQLAQGNNPGNQGVNQGQQAMKDAIEQAMAQMQGGAQAANANNAAKEAADAAAQAAGQCQGGGGQGQGKNGQAQAGGQGQWNAGNPQNQGGGQGAAGIGAGGNMGKAESPYDVVRKDSPTRHRQGEIISSTLLHDGKFVKGENVAKLREIAAVAEREATDEVEESRTDRKTAEIMKKYFRALPPD